MVEPLESARPGLGRDASTLLRPLRLEGVILLPPLSDLPAAHIAPMHEAPPVGSRPS